MYVYTRILYLGTACNHIITLEGNIRVCPLLKGFSKQKFHYLMYQYTMYIVYTYYNGVPSAPSAQYFVRYSIIMYS